MYRRGNARFADFSIHFMTLLGVKGKRKHLTSVFLLGIFIAFRGFTSICTWRALPPTPTPPAPPPPFRAAYETVKAGQRLLGAGRHASLSSSFSEIEFGRARPTSLLHSTIHLLIPSGEERGSRSELAEWEEGGEEEVGREGADERGAQSAKGWKWLKEGK